MRLLSAFLLLATVLVTAAAPAHAQERKLPPVDEASADASWLRFKKQLVDAIQKANDRATAKARA